MSKSFQQFREDAQGVPAKDLKPKKDDDKEATDLKPRSKGEEDFKNSHKKDEVKHPVAAVDQFSHKDNNPHDHKGFDGEPGERKPIKQGSSNVSKDGKDGATKKSPPRSADKTGGETKPVKQGSSNIKEEQDSESVMDTLRNINESGNPMKVEFTDGTSLLVDLNTASKLTKIHESLNSFNKEKFEENVEKDRSSFKKMMDFSGKV